MPEELYRTLGYLWAAFGVYWVAASAGRSSSDGAQPRSPLRFAYILVPVAVLFVLRQRIPALLFVAIALAWSGLILYSMATPKNAQSAELRFYRPLRLFIMATTFCLLFWKDTAIGFLARRFVPYSNAVAVAGFLVALTGLAIAIWARVYLGRYWSDKVVLQQDHKLVRTGPYAYMRHPIYTGVLLGIAGTAVILGEIRGVVAFLLLLSNYAIKAKQEEKLLAGEFGEEFSIHRKEAGFLFPKFR